MIPETGGHGGLSIVQVIREIGAHGGSSGVAAALRDEFTRLDVANRTICRRRDGGSARSRLAAKLDLLFGVVTFTISGTIRTRLARRPDTVIIVHNEALGGDIYVDHGLHKAVVANNPRMMLRNPIHLFLLGREELRHRLGLYRRIVVLSAYSEEVLFRHYPCVPREKVVRIPNGIDLARFAAPNRLPDGTLRLVFIGHEFDRKRLDPVIEALALLPDSVSLTVIGGSPQEIAAREALAVRLGVSARVHFLGRRSDIPKLLAEQDILLLPSRFEAWPLVVVEAMAAGVPVLMTPVGSGGEVIVEGETGHIIVDDAADIAAKLRPYIVDPARLGPMRTAAREMAGRYSWDSIARKYLDLAAQVRAERDR